jgi:hypothetical protein
MKLPLILILLDLAMWAAQPGPHWEFVDRPEREAAEVPQLSDQEGGQPSVPSNPISNWAVAVVGELRMLQPVPECNIPPALRWSCAQTATIEVSRHLKDASLQTPITVEGVRLPALLRYVSAGSRGWDRVMGRGVGMKFLIASTTKKDLRSVVVSPDVAIDLHDDEDMIGDVELILKCQSMSIEEQVHVIADAIIGGGKSRTYLLAMYIGELWKFESDTEFAVASQALQSAESAALSNDAKWLVLSGLSPDPNIPDVRRRRLWPLFVTLTAR